MYRAILVPLDGSTLSEQALPLAADIAGRAGASLCLAHVHCASAPLDYSDDDRDMQARWDKRASLAMLAQRLSAESGVSVRFALLDSPSPAGDCTSAAAQGIAAALHAHAAASDIDLVVMTTNGHSGAGQAQVGSVADALTQRSTVPLVRLRPRAAPPAPTATRHFKHILIPLDGSPLAEHAIAPVIALGDPAETTYTLLQAINPLVSYPSSSPYTSSLRRQENHQIEISARIYLTYMAERLIRRVPHIETHLVVGTPATAILDYARERQADLIALCTHGRGGLARPGIGRVADTVMHDASSPVLVYRPGHTPHWHHSVHSDVLDREQATRAEAANFAAI